MQALRSDVFALKKSGLEAFLYAEVGIEANGSMLTILSVLARLGKDPWTEAARWASLPKARASDSLAQSIGEMPLAPSALAGARESADRLVQLLPTNTQSVQMGNSGRSATGTATDTPKMMPITLLYFALAAWIALNILLVSKPPSSVAAASGQSTATSEATNTTPKLLAPRVPVTDSSSGPGRQ